MPWHLKNMTLRQLRALAATVRGGSLTAAAEALGVTQPAITLQLQNLQELASMPLIQRTPDGVSVTDAGREVLRLDERIGIALADCIQALEAIKNAGGGRVAIGAVSTSKYFVPAAISAFKRLHPGIELKLTVGNRAQIMDGLRNFSLDVAITGRPPDDMDLEKRLIGPHPHIVIAPWGHPLTHEKGLKLEDLMQETFLLREPGSGTRGLMERLFEDAGLSPKIGMEIDSNETIKQAVIAGLGIALISAHTVASEIEYRRIVALDVEGLPVMRQWFVLRRADKHLLPPARALMDFLATEAARFLPVVA